MSQQSHIQLPNAIHVCSITSPGAFAAAGVLLKTGPFVASQPANAKASFAAFVLEKLAFTATRNWSETQMQTRLDQLVGLASAKASREHLLFSAAVMPTQVVEVMEMLSEVATAPAVRQEDLREIKEVVRYQIAELFNKPDELMPEMAHGPAFYAGSDGAWDRDANSLLAHSSLVDSLRVEDVHELHGKIMAHPENVVVLGAGIEHERLLAAASKTIGSFVFPAHVPVAVSTPLHYLGGHNYVENAEMPLTHVSLAFEGAPAADADSYALAILQMLLGGGGSFSAGGPGKGMYSRLYTLVLNRYHWVECARVFNFAYRHTGLFGIHGTSLPSHARELVQVLLSQLRTMASNLTGQELARAKNQVKSAIFMGLESRVTQTEDLADQVYHFGRAVGASEICSRIDAVTEGDLEKVAKRVVASVPTVAAYGPLHKMPDYGTIRSWCQMLK